MQDPPHPGEIVRWECLEPLSLTVTRAAQGLGVTRQALSDLVNGKSGVSVEMAVRLSRAFGSSPETWIGMQEMLAHYRMLFASEPNVNGRQKAILQAIEDHRR